MKQFLLSAVVALYTCIGLAQCPTQIITLTSQEDVNNFSSYYPNCTDLPFGLRVQYSNTTDLSPLSYITSIGGDLEITEARDLVSISGLTGLTHIAGSLLIHANSNLEEISGFVNLTTVGGHVSIFANNSLLNISDLNSLESTGASFAIRSNLVLQNFPLLSNLSSVGEDFSLTNQSEITNIDGLESLVSVGESFVLRNVRNLQTVNTPSLQEISNLNIYFSDLENLDFLTSVSPSSVSNIYIWENEFLDDCSIQAICENLSNPNTQISINSNIGFCANLTEVAIRCSEVFIPDNNFLDALVNHTPTIDTNSDGNIQFEEAEAFTGALNVSEEMISDFTGLEAFVNITGFDGSGNFASELSLESNTALTSIDFSNNPDLRKVFLKNENNTAITSFNGVDCPSLEFVCVDDIAFAVANFTNIDPQVIFVEDCEVLTVAGFNIAEAVSVFPNPVSDNLTISLASSFSFIKAEIYTISGQKLMETSASQINMSDFSAGIYFVKVISKQGSITKKIIKE